MLSTCLALGSDCPLNHAYTLARVMLKCCAISCAGMFFSMQRRPSCTPILFGSALLTNIANGSEYPR